MSSVIYGNSAQNEIIVKQSLFQYNDMIFNNTRVRTKEIPVVSFILKRILTSSFFNTFSQPDTHSFIIESLGPTTIENTCFQDNLVGASNVVVFGNTFESKMNYATNTSGSLCGFSSVFQNIQQFDAFTPDCVEATSDACVRYMTSPPSISPSDGPTPIATDAPSAVPTTGPTITPYPTEDASATPTSELGDTLAPTAPVIFTFPTEAPGSAANAMLASARQPTIFLCMSAILCSFFL